MGDPLSNKLGILIQLRAPLSTIEELLAGGANPNYEIRDNCVLITEAVNVGEISYVKALLEYGAVATPETLHLAAMRGYVDMVKMFIGGVDVNAADDRGETAMHKAKHVEMLKTLINLGGDVNALTKSGRTPLHYASELEREESVKLLISRGANVDISSKLGHTPLMAAAREGQSGVARILIDGGANLNVDDGYGWTALELAIEYGHSSTAKLLRLIEKV